MQATATDVADAEQRFPEKLALDGEIPGPRLWVLEGFALCGHHQGNAIGSVPSRIVDGSERYASVGLEGRISTEEDGIADAEAGEEAAAACANHGLVVELVGNTRARLNVAPLNVGIVIGQTSEQAI